MRNKLKFNYYQYYTFYHLIGLILTVIICNGFMNPAACSWFIDNEIAANIEHATQDLFNQQGYESPSVYTVERMSEMSNEDYEKYRLLQEYQMRQVELKYQYLKSITEVKKVLKTQYIPPESHETQVQDPVNNISLQDLLNRQNAKTLLGEDVYNIIKRIKELGLKYPDKSMSKELSKELSQLLPNFKTTTTFYSDILNKEAGDHLHTIKKLTAILKDTHDVHLKHYIGMYYYYSYLFTDLNNGLPLDYDKANSVYTAIKNTY